MVTLVIGHIGHNGHNGHIGNDCCINSTRSDQSASAQSDLTSPAHQIISHTEGTIALSLYLHQFSTFAFQCVR